MGSMKIIMNMDSKSECVSGGGGGGGGDQLEMMASIGPECNELKRAYDNCFNAWFADNFLKGDNRLTTCDALLASYTHCVKAALKARNVDLEEIDKDHLGTSSEKRKP